MIAWVLVLLRLAAAEPETGSRHLVGTLAPVVQQQLALAQAREQAGDLKGASAGYRLVLGRAPAFVPAVMGLGRVRLALGDRAGAIETYETLPHEADAVEQLAELVLDDEPARAADLLERLVVLRPGEPEIYDGLVVALVNADRVPDALRYLNVARQIAPSALQVGAYLALGRALCEAGDVASCVEVLEDALVRFPDAPDSAEIRGRLDRVSVERAARRLATGSAEPLSVELNAQLLEGISLAASNEVAEAYTLVRTIVQAAPRSSAARATLGGIQRARGDVEAAERSYRWAVALEPDNPDWRARLGDLLVEEYGGRRNMEAMDEYRSALALRPAWAPVLLRLGGLLQQSGRWEAAIDAFRRVQELDPEGSAGTEAGRQLERLQREAPAPPDLASLKEEQHHVPAAARKGYRIARVYLERGDLDSAGAELVPVRLLAPDWAAPLNLEAVILARKGDVSAAVERWQESLSLDPEQAHLYLSLGEHALRQGEQAVAIQRFEEAAERGSADAHYRLAVIAFEQRRWFLARQLLDEYFSLGVGGLYVEPAEHLRDEVHKRIELLFLTSATGALGGFGLIGFWAVRRRAERPLSAFVSAVPDVSQDVVRILAAIRHEVLKHNTSLLGEVGTALEDGDHAAVRYAANRLFGRADVDSEGVGDRLRQDIIRLERMGHAHGVRLNLRRCDPVLAPLWGAMKELQALEKFLRAPELAPADVSEKLRDLSERLNEQAYQALGRMIGEFGVVQILPARLLAVAARVADEPGFAGCALPEVDVVGPPEGVAVRVLATDLDDVAANLIRNAWRAGATRTAIMFVDEDDPITGLAYLALRFLDDGDATLTISDIQRRSPTRGLGLVSDLVARHDGFVAVEQDADEQAAGWSKAVVVRLLRAESEPEAG